METRGTRRGVKSGGDGDRKTEAKKPMRKVSRKKKKIQIAPSGTLRNLPGLIGLDACTTVHIIEFMEEVS